MFNIGDMVCYPMHGVGAIEAIEEHVVLGETTRYYMLRFLGGRITAMVPVHTADAVGLRLVISARECECVKEYMATIGAAESDNWNQRYRENMEKLRAGDVYGVADVVKGLIKRDRERGLSAGERKMLATARGVLLAELSAASGEEPEFFSDLL